MIDNLFEKIIGDLVRKFPKEDVNRVELSDKLFSGKLYVQYSIYSMERKSVDLIPMHHSDDNNNFLISQERSKELRERLKDYYGENNVLVSYIGKAIQE